MSRLFSPPDCLIKILQDIIVLSVCAWSIIFTLLEPWDHNDDDDNDDDDDDYDGEVGLNDDYFEHDNTHSA